MNRVETAIPDAIILEPKVFGDARGFFVETYSAKRYAEAGIPETFVQDNISFSQRGVLRGLHFQNPNGQGKLVQVLQGEVYDVAVDIRLGSPTFSRWVGVILSAENKRQFFIPAGFAHGFCVLSETALFHYKCTEYYAPANEGGIAWNDTDIGIEWPMLQPTLSAKDSAFGPLKNYPVERLPRYRQGVR
ncbi:MAG: dTDP-4-dehydrorhamnose 3,5-epimerase [Sedimentisphaerales bacterium]|nr:dTDP-4-dehydrorhamnose 3,5-epimerase [Sedimentisphaerales bacterium]